MPLDDTGDDLADLLEYPATAGRRAETEQAAHERGDGPDDDGDFWRGLMVAIPPSLAIYAAFGYLIFRRFR